MANLKNIQYCSIFNWHVNFKNTTKIVFFVDQIGLLYFMEDDNFCIFYGSPCIWDKTLHVFQLGCTHTLDILQHTCTQIYLSDVHNGTNWIVTEKARWIGLVCEWICYLIIDRCFADFFFGRGDSNSYNCFLQTRNARSAW